jgi:hypothetical protein
MTKDEEILSLHRQLAAEKLRADTMSTRHDAKSRECIELRKQIALESEHVFERYNVERAAIRNEVLEEMAEKIEAMNDSAGDRAAYENRDMTCCEDTRMWLLKDCVDCIRAMKAHAPTEKEDAALTCSAGYDPQNCPDNEGHGCHCGYGVEENKGEKA